MAKRIGKKQKQLNKQQQKAPLVPVSAKPGIYMLDVPKEFDELQHVPDGMDVTGMSPSKAERDAKAEKMKELYRRDPVAHGKLVDDMLLRDTFGRVYGAHVSGMGDESILNVSEETTRKELLDLAPVPALRTIYPEDKRDGIGRAAHILLSAFNDATDKAARLRIADIMENAQDSDRAMRAFYSRDPIKNLKLVEAKDWDGLDKSLAEEAATLEKEVADLPKKDYGLEAILRDPKYLAKVPFEQTQLPLTEGEADELSRAAFRADQSFLELQSISRYARPRDIVTFDGEKFVVKQLPANHPYFDKFPLLDTKFEIDYIPKLYSKMKQLAKAKDMTIAIPSEVKTPTGWAAFDKQLDGGFKPGDLWVIGSTHRHPYNPLDFAGTIYGPLITKYTAFYNDYKEKNPEATQKQFFEHVKENVDVETRVRWNAANAWIIRGLPTTDLEGPFDEKTAQYYLDLQMPSELLEGLAVDPNTVQISLESNTKLPLVRRLKPRELRGEVFHPLVHGDMNWNPENVDTAAMPQSPLEYGMSALLGEDGSLNIRGFNPINPEIAEMKNLSPFYPMSGAGHDRAAMFRSHEEKKEEGNEE